MTRFIPASNALSSANQLESHVGHAGELDFGEFHRLWQQLDAEREAAEAAVRPLAHLTCLATHALTVAGCCLGSSFGCQSMYRQKAAAHHTSQVLTPLPRPQSVQHLTRCWLLLRAEGAG